MTIFQRIGIVSVVVCGLFLSTMPAASQCMVASTPTTMGTQGGMAYIGVSKVLSGSYLCSLKVSSNVIPFCNLAGGAATVTYLTAAAFTTAANPICQWSCDCGMGPESIAIDGNDGLPVELMEFSVEDGEAGEPADEGGEEAEGSAAEETEPAAE